jgi:hypothetical protein
VAVISESCSVCGGEFEVQFRYQMEERDGGFLFFLLAEVPEEEPTLVAPRGRGHDMRRGAGARPSFRRGPHGDSHRV